PGAEARAALDPDRDEGAIDQGGHVEAVPRHARPCIIAKRHLRPDEHVVLDDIAGIDESAVTDLAAIAEPGAVDDGAARDRALFADHGVADHRGKLPDLRQAAD